MINLRDLLYKVVRKIMFDQLIQGVKLFNLYSENSPYVETRLRRNLNSGIYPSLYSCLGKTEFSFQKLVTIKIEDAGFIMLEKNETAPDEEFIGGGFLNNNQHFKIDYDHFTDKKQNTVKNENNLK